MAAKLKTGDRVVVLTGRDKGQEGDILSIDPTAGRARVGGINMVTRHQRQTQTTAGGRIQVTLEIERNFARPLDHCSLLEHIPAGFGDHKFAAYSCN